MVRFVAALIAVLAASGAEPAAGESARIVRFATFNAALTENEQGALVRRLEGGGDREARLVAETIQRVRPDVLLLQEIDRDDAQRSLALLLGDYLAVPQNGADPIAYPHTLFPPSNTGVPSGVDLDGDGRIGGPNDARGFGRHPGQYAFALLSRFPLGPARTFADLLWRDMPGNLMPAEYYSAAAREVLPLSSKTHLAVPVEVGDGLAPVHVLAAHPTPPVFDDARDWNGRRNADEIRMLADLLDPAAGAYLVDDAGLRGGLPADAAAVVMGDLNADPARGDSRPGAIARLLDNAPVAPLAAAALPTSAFGDATAEFGGGLRVDYVLPVRLVAVRAGVVWFPAEHPLARLNEASDHRMVWVDAIVPAATPGQPAAAVPATAGQDSIDWALDPPGAAR